MTDQAPQRAVPASGLIAVEGPDQPSVGVAELQQRVAGALTAAFPDRMWLCGEIVGTPAVRGGGVGIAFTLAESRGNAVVTLRAWLGRPYYQQLQQSLGKAAVAELIAVGNLVVVGGYLQYGGPYSSLELKVDRVVRTPVGAGVVTMQRENLQREFAASGLLGRQRVLQLPLAPRRVGIVAGAAGTVGYRDAVTVLEQSGYDIVATHFPAQLEGQGAGDRIAAQIRAASVGHQVVLVVRGGGEDAQLSAFDSAPVITAIAAAPVPVITGIGHSHHTTLADTASHQACASPAHAAGVIAERVQNAGRTLEREQAAIRRMADVRLATQRAARRRRLGLTVALAGLAGLAIWRWGWPAAALVALVAAAIVVARRRGDRSLALAPQPAAETFEDVVQELGAIKNALQRTAVTDDDVRRLLQAAEWLDRCGGELLGRPRSPDQAVAGATD